MAKRTDTERLSPLQAQSSPKRNRLQSDEMGLGEQNGESPGLDTFQQILDKLSNMDMRMEEHFGSLKSEISCLRHELREEIEGVKNTLHDVEKSLEGAWDAISDLQKAAESHSDFKNTIEPTLQSHQEDLDNMKSSMKNQEAEIQALKSKLADEQEKIIALESYSRRENLRFMNIPEQSDENCVDTVYDIIENELNIGAEEIQFHAVHRVGKPRSTVDASDTSPRPIIARFLCREDRDTVFRAKGRLKKSARFKDAYITQDYARAVQLERRTLIKAMYQAKEKGLQAKVVDRNLTIGNMVYHVGNIPIEFMPPSAS